VAKPKRPLAELRAFRRSLDRVTGISYFRRAVPTPPNPAARLVRSILRQLPL